MTLAERKRIRLDEDSYRGGDVFLVTVCTHTRKPLFAKEPAASACLRLALDVAHRTRTELYAACVMPDHVHMLVSCGAGAGLFKFMAQFKSETTKALRRAGHDGAVWQKRFHDHGLRQNERTDVVARYVLDNPVRAGLTTVWSAWKYSWWIERDGVEK